MGSVDISGENWKSAEHVGKKGMLAFNVLKLAYSRGPCALSEQVFLYAHGII